MSLTKITDQQKSDILSWPRTNPSSKRRGLEYYYDAETIDLVYQRDRLIVEKFGYEPPRLPLAEEAREVHMPSLR